MYKELDISKLTPNLPPLALLIPGNLTTNLNNLAAIYVLVIWGRRCWNYWVWLI
jgi:hypothetical protein